MVEQTDGTFVVKDDGLYCIHDVKWDGSYMLEGCPRCSSLVAVMESRPIDADLPRFGESDVAWMRRLESEYVSAGLLPPAAATDESAT